jgi:phosphatidylinositol-3-phosphatase
VAALSTGGGAFASAAHPPRVGSTPRSVGVPSFSHVFVIIGENTSASEITPSRAPFITGTLMAKSAVLTNYHSLPHTDSTGDYIGMTSGQFNRCEAKDVVPNRCHQTVPNLFTQLDSASIPWQEWNESMDNSCDYIEHGFDWSQNVYSSHHSPALYYTQVEGGVYSEEIPPSPECLTRVLSMGTTAPNDTSAFNAALATGNVGRFDFIVPNDCENGHDTCGTDDPVGQFDDFLAREVPLIEASPAFDAGSVIFITWDEGADPPLEPHHPLALVTGPLASPGVHAQELNHYSLLRTLEEGFGLSLVGRAGKAAPFPSIWR